MATLEKKNKEKDQLIENLQRKALDGSFESPNKKLSKMLPPIDQKGAGPQTLADFLGINTNEWLAKSRLQEIDKVLQSNF